MATPTNDEKRMYLMFHGWTRSKGSIDDIYEIWSNGERAFYFLKDAYNCVRDKDGQIN
jgi:hypothetical protein